MSNLERLCHESSDLLRQIETRLGQYDQAGDDFAANVEAEIQELIRQITANFERLDILLDKEPTSRRQHFKLRVDQIKYDFQHIQSAFRSLQRRRVDKIKEARQREELLATDFSRTGNGHTSIHIDADLRHHTSLRNVNRNMEDMISHGQQILGNLREQRINLKSIKSRVLDIGTKLGLSTTVMKMIERRGTQDKYIFYGGAIFTLCFMFAMYWFLV
ncbi:Golgi SNAP receptor complex member 2-like [Paramacrobiotus metropolitanus]|uniref:Golgi SNAP receptor complex member 2-like n=1 Tax=Paramacrobiotus metropolitanus TaxID=2943436 RepID=UPI00244634E9|nr:Golgi SNAP receptor complex member 2-like [Paramacrobiotus metropolitanus]